MIKAVILFIALCFVASIAAAPQGSVCDTCQLVVTQLENYVNQTEPEIEKQLVKACAQLPPQIEGLCDTIVLVYGHQIIQSLLKKESPQLICQQLRLCPKNNTVVAEKKALPNDLQCTLCKLLVQAAESFVSQNKTEQQILDGLHKVCEALPSFWKDQCKALVDQYTPQIIEFLKQKYPAEAICQKISLCKSQVDAAALEPKVAVTNDYCDLCHQIATWVEDYIEGNATSEKIIEALTKVCNYTGQYESMCKAMLPVIWAQLVKKLHDQEPPAVICKQLHLCAAKVIAAAPKVSNAQLCNGCKYLVAVADNFVTKNSTEQHIVQTVEKVCEYFPASYKGVCQAVVEQYGPQIVEQLVQKVLDPTKVCTAVKACPKQAPTAEEIVAAHGFKIKLN